MFPRWSPCTCNCRNSVSCAAGCSTQEVPAEQQNCTAHLHDLAIFLVLLDVAVAVVSLLDCLKHPFQVEVVIQALGLVAR